MADMLQGFKISSERVSLTSLPAVVVKMIGVVSRLPDNELITTEQLATRCRVSRSHLRNHTSGADLEPYRTLLHNAYLWGNAKTTIRLKTRLKNAH